MADDGTHLYQNLDLPPVVEEPDVASVSPDGSVERSLVQLARAQEAQARSLQTIASSVGFIAVVIGISLALGVIGLIVSLIIAARDDGSDSSSNSRFGAIVRTY
jgi:hypothetical protein